LPFPITYLPIENQLIVHNRNSSDNKEIANNKSQISDNFQDPISYFSRLHFWQEITFMGRK
jgi:hypothetical protein